MIYAAWVSGALNLLINLMLRLVTALPGVERELRLLPTIVRRGDVCLDIGASFGVYSVTLAMIAGRGGSVHAVEPRRSAARRLRRIARLFGIRQLTVHECAVGDCARSADIVVPGRRMAVPGRSYLSAGALHDDHDDGLVEQRRQRVEVRTVDELRQRIGRRIALIKCDVEGFELAVLRGANTVLGSDRPMILCEVEAHHTARYGHRPEDVADFLRAHHYRPVALGRTGSPDGRNQLWAPVPQQVPVGSFSSVDSAVANTHPVTPAAGS